MDADTHHAPDSGPRSTRDLERELPGALARAARDGGRLAEALADPVEQALRIAARRNPAAVADALATAVGPALVRAVVTRIRGWAMAFNRLVLVTVSAYAWRWRAEAWRTGRRYADVVRDHTFSRPIRQVLLIHRRTGLLLGSVSRDEDAALDGDMVSAMLTAIQDFAQDSFSPGREDRLQSFRVGQTAVWVEQGRHAILAGVVDGEPTAEMRPVFRDALERIHRDFAGPLSTFDGGVTVFEPARLYLEACVRSRFRTAGDRLLPLTWGLFATAATAAALLATAHLRAAIAWNAYVTEIAAQPGIVVLESGRRQGRFYVKGLHDPLALDPVSMLNAMDIDRQDVRADWQPFMAPIPQLALLRARQVLRPPDTVSFAITGSVLRVSGAASREWIEEAGRLARVVPGLTSLELAGVTPAEVRAKQLWNRYVESLANEPGLVVLSSGSRDGHHVLRGLRDPAAIDPLRRMGEMGINTAEVDVVWEPYDAGGAPFVLARAVRVLAPPKGVDLAVEGSVLVARGEASHSWIREARTLARAISGVTAFRTDGLKNTDLTSIRAAADEIASQVFVVFDQRTDLVPGQARKVERIVNLIRTIDDRAQAIREAYTVEIRGHVTDGPDEEGNVGVSETLARRFMDLLEHQNLDLHRCRLKAMGSVDSPADTGNARGPKPKRAVTVRVLVPAAEVQ